MSDIDAARRRLDAVAGVDWGEVTYTSLYDYWVCVGPVHATRPEDGVLEAKHQQDAIMDFLRHAADDIRALLEDHERAR
jgi:hypothetical protein